MREVTRRIEQINQERFAEMNGRKIISVSKMIEYVSEPFDKEGQAKACAAKGLDDPNYKYAGMSAQQIIDMWEAKADESRRYGSLLDDYTEQYFTGTEQSREIWKLDNNFDYDERLRANCLGFEQFYADIHKYGFEFEGREIAVYGESVPDPLAITNTTDPQLPDVTTGRIDCLFYNKEKGKYIIVDWKTTDDIKTTAFCSKRMKGPAFTYQDCDLSKYMIQVQTYKRALVETYHLGTPENISVVICNLRKEPDPHTGRNYILYKENVAYNSKTLSDIISFAIKKRELLKASMPEQATPKKLSDDNNPAASLF